MNLQLSAILFRAPWNPLYVRFHIMSLLRIVPSSPHVSAPRNWGPDKNADSIACDSWTYILSKDSFSNRLSYATNFPNREFGWEGNWNGPTPSLMNAPKIRVRGYFFIRAWSLRSLVVTPYWRAPKRAKQLSMATIPLCTVSCWCLAEIIFT